MATIFTRIIDGELPGHFVWQDDVCVAFLSINPLARGHTLVVPRAEIDHWLDLDDSTRDHLFNVAQKIGRVLQTRHRPAKVGMMLAGLEVPHVHVHVVPINGVHDLDFANAAKSVDQDELAEEAAALRAEM